MQWAKSGNYGRNDTVRGKGREKTRDVDHPIKLRLAGPINIWYLCQDVYETCDITTESYMLI